jgi:hypothetical protein
MAVIEGGVSANLAEVDANNRIKVNLDTGANPAQVGGVRFFSENDAASNLLVSPETDDDYRLRIAQESVYDWETFNYTAQNTGKHIYRNTTMANTWSTAGLTTNSGNITTTTTGTLFQSYAFFPLIGASQLYGEFEGSVNANTTTNMVIDFGFFLAGATTPYAPTDGIYFRLTSAGWQGVINFNGVETTAALTFTHTINRKYQFQIVAHEQEVRFWVDGTLYATIETPVGQGQPCMAGSLPIALRHANTGTAGAAISFVLNDYAVTVGGPAMAERPSVIGQKALGSYQGLSGGTMGSLASYANSTNPTAAAPSNTALTANLPNGLGGQGAVTAALAAATDGIWGSYQVPAGTVSVQGRRLVLRGVRIDAVNLGAAVATTATTLQFSLAFGHNAVSLATAEAATTKAPRRVALGYMTWPVGAAIGAQPQTGEIVVDFGDAPIYVNPGEFVQLVGKFLVGTATASQVINFVWQPVYGWE